MQKSLTYTNKHRHKHTNDTLNIITRTHRRHRIVAKTEFHPRIAKSKTKSCKANKIETNKAKQLKEGSQKRTMTKVKLSHDSRINFIRVCVCVKRESTRPTQTQWSEFTNTNRNKTEHTHIHLFVLTIDICKVRVNLNKFMGQTRKRRKRTQ